MKKIIYAGSVRIMQSAPFVKIYKCFSGSRLSRPLVRPFIKFSGIKEDELAMHYRSYHTLRQLFTRELPKGVFPVNSRQGTLVSPSEGKLTAAGKIQDQTDFFVKGSKQTIEDLLVFPDVYQTYKQGSFAVIYLAPKDYHRVHAPLSGRLHRRYALGEKSDPVNALGFRFGNAPLMRNYRVISEYETAYGKTAVIKVGALNVNSVEISAHSFNLEKGEEMARFSLGSTVIVLNENADWHFNECGDQINTACRAGEEIAKFNGVSL